MQTFSVLCSFAFEEPACIERSLVALQSQTEAGGRTRKQVWMLRPSDPSLLLLFPVKYLLFCLQKNARSGTREPAMAFQMVQMVAAVLVTHACVCKSINIHVGVVKTGLPKDQTFHTVQGSMGSLVAHQ